MSWEQRNADFCKAQTDAQIAYIEAERRVKELETENAKLRELVRDMYGNYRAGWNEEIEDELYDRMRELGVEA